MHATASTRVAQPTLFPQWLIVLFFKCISKHAKRIFYIASLNGYLNHYATKHRLAADRLNAAIRLAYREETLRQSETFSTQVWGNSGLETILSEDALAKANSEEALHVLAQRVVDVAPPWTRFTKNPQEIVGAVLEMLKSRRHEMLALA